MSRPRAIFFGSPEFAVPCLSALAELADVRLVITQPDRPAGRGLELRPPAVKVRALELGLPVEQPTKVRTAAFAQHLRDHQADVGIVVAYGRILPRAVLDAPRIGCLNVHASLLPRWRGAAPIQWAVVHGDAETGVTLMQMDEGMDTGPMLATLRTPIGEDETAGELTERLSALGAELLRRELGRALAGELVPEAQDDALATKAVLLEKTHGRVDWSLPAQAVHDHVRGMSPWPGAYTSMEGETLKVHRTRLVAPGGEPFGLPGTVRVSGGALEVACGAGRVEICELQLPGKKRLRSEQYLAGRTLPAGLRLGT